MRTKHRWYRFALTCVVLCWCGGSLPAAGDDWPQWYGVNRDGKSAETGLLSTWPADGPRQVWAAQGAGTGYSSVAVSDGRVITMGNHGDAGYRQRQAAAS